MNFEMVFSPAIIITIAAALLGLIVKAVRLQWRVEEQDDEIKWLGETVAEQKGVLDAHRANSDIHFNLRLSQEVDKRNEQRFKTIESDLREIKQILRSLAERK